MLVSSRREVTGLVRKPKACVSGVVRAFGAIGAGVGRWDVVIVRKSCPKHVRQALRNWYREQLVLTTVGSEFLPSTMTSDRVSRAAALEALPTIVDLVADPNPSERASLETAAVDLAILL